MTEPTPTPTPAPAPAPAPSPDPAPAPTPTAFDWKGAGLDEVGLGTVQNKGWKGPADVVNSYVHLERLAKGDPNTLLRLPTTDDPAAWGEVYTKLGRPATAAEYSFKAPEGQDGAFAETAKSWFHEAGLSDKAAGKVVEKWNEYAAGLQKQQETAFVQQAQADLNQLKIEWGTAHDANIALAKRAAGVFGLDQPTMDKMERAMGTATLMKFMHNLGSRLGTDDQFVTGNDGRLGFNQSSPAGARARIDELGADKAFMAKVQAGDAASVAEWNRLFRAAYPPA
jgi:hypothetical protein